MSESYFDKSILITGGSSGIGFGIAKLLASEGAHLLILAREQSLTDSIKTDLLSQHENCRVDLISCDITKNAQIQNAVELIRSRTSVIDLLINNAGYATYELFVNIQFEETIKLAATNFIGHVAMTSALVPLVRSADNGHICFVNSVGAKIPITPNSVYGAAKKGLEGFADVLHYELQLDGICVTSVFPGRIVTPFFNHWTFRNRVEGLETKLTFPVDRACSQIVRGLKKRKRNIYVPKYWQFIAYVYQIDPFVSRMLFSLVLKKRLRQIRSVSQNNYGA